MRRYTHALLLMLFFALPLAAHADSFLYTVVWNFAGPPTIDLSSFKGTYTFTTDTLLTGTTFVYGGPVVPTSYLSGFPYYYAADLTAPAGTNVASIMIQYYPQFSSPWAPTQTSSYGVGLYARDAGPASVAGLVQNPFDPYNFYNGAVSLQITPISTPPAVPEPSTLLLIGTGALAITSRLRRLRL